MQLDPNPHPAEGELQSLFDSANPNLGAVVSDARAGGIPWPKILDLVIEFGPKAIAALKAIVDALKTPPPTP